MIEYKLTEDLGEIHAVLRHPDILGINEDGLEDVDYPITPVIKYFCMLFDGEPVGIIMAMYRTLTVMDCHISVLKECRGACTGEFMEWAEYWVKNNTDIKKLTVCIPEFNEAAIKRAKKSGFKFEGINTKSFLKDGELIDQVYLGKEL